MCATYTHTHPHTHSHSLTQEAIKYTSDVFVCMWFVIRLWRNLIFVVNAINPSYFLYKYFSLLAKESQWIFFLVSLRQRHTHTHSMRNISHISNLLNGISLFERLPPNICHDQNFTKEKYNWDTKRTISFVLIYKPNIRICELYSDKRVRASFVSNIDLSSKKSFLGVSQTNLYFWLFWLINIRETVGFVRVVEKSTNNIPTENLQLSFRFIGCQVLIICQIF